MSYIIPKDWKLVPLGALINPVIRTETVLAKKEYKLVGVRWYLEGVHIHNVQTGSEIKTTSLSRVEKDDIIYNKMWTSKAAFAIANENHHGAYGSTEYPQFRAKPKVLNVHFLKYVYHLPRFLYDAKTLCRGTTGRIRLNPKDFLKIEIPLPSLPEQKKIAEILGTWDNAIELTGKLIQAKTRRKKGLMQQLLTGKKRFGEFVKRKGYKKSKVGKIPKEWGLRHLEKCAEVLFSNVDKKADKKEKQVLLCNYTDVYYNDYITQNLDFMQATAKVKEIEKYSLKKGDVIITKDSETPDDIAVPAFVSEKLKNVLCGYHLALIRPDRKVLLGEYLSKLFQLQIYRYYFFTLANGVTRFGLTTQATLQSLIPLPSIAEQKKIAAILTACDKEIDLLSQKLEALKQQKKGLMQKLLTGEIRVNHLVRVKQLKKK
ncbi:restriction endonuclease subunit S [Desulfonema magnum]|uniref:Type-1 restriction enzyme EcoKI, HsdS-like n=1 Tax=Desulfonema magnum TaxID=45655 RepID=A0A975BGY1_9BACT|nr:restriction endonuclease subunit S [Desulfonema magnum]QTA84850.1 Putative type-1 restriction enzyme EcoKI, HsdS-like [Desulfonema magnum]